MTDLVSEIRALQQLLAAVNEKLKPAIRNAAVSSRPTTCLRIQRECELARERIAEHQRIAV